MNFKEGEVLYFDKPLKWTSFAVVNKIRYHICRKLGVKKIKVGHAGTLDPLATGVMIICTGKATKRIEEFQYHTKEYIATLQLGATTPSFDLEKEIDATYPTEHITRELVEEALQRFIGRIEQIPPVFSACKVDGKRAYDLARKGEDVELKAKTLIIDEIELLECNLPEIKIRVVCSKGTYIRTLSVDLGQKLGYAAHMSHLTRTSAAGLSLEDALTLEEVAEKVAQGDLSFLHPLEIGTGDLEKVELTVEEVGEVQVGRFIPVESGSKELAAFYQGKLVAILEKEKNFTNLEKSF